jgi:hypothetical protein
MIGKPSGLLSTYFNPSLNNVVILLCHIPYFLCFHRQNGVNAFHFTVLGHLLWIHVLTCCSFDTIMHMCNQPAEVLKDVKI